MSSYEYGKDSFNSVDLAKAQTAILQINHDSLFAYAYRPRPGHAYTVFSHACMWLTYWSDISCIRGDFAHRLPNPRLQSD